MHARRREKIAVRKEERDIGEDFYLLSPISYLLSPISYFLLEPAQAGFAAGRGEACRTVRYTPNPNAT